MSDNLETGVLLSLIILIFYILGAHVIEINKVLLKLPLNTNIID